MRIVGKFILCRILSHRTTKPLPTMPWFTWVDPRWVQCKRSLTTQFILYLYYIIVRLDDFTKFQFVEALNLPEGALCATF